MSFCEIWLYASQCFSKTVVERKRRERKKRHWTDFNRPKEGGWIQEYISFAWWCIPSQPFPHFHELFVYFVLNCLLPVTYFLPQSEALCSLLDFFASYFSLFLKPLLNVQLKPAALFLQAVQLLLLLLQFYFIYSWSPIYSAVWCT